VLLTLALYYIALSSIAWLAESRLNVDGILRGILFLLASPLYDIAVSPFLRRRAWQNHPVRSLVIFSIGGIINVASEVAALIVAWLAGYRLWYPQFAVYLAIAWLLMRVITRIPFSESSGIVARDEFRGSRAVYNFFGGLTGTIFAVCVVADAQNDTLIWVGMIAALVFAISKIDRQSLGHRLSTALGNPRGQLLSPPRTDLNRFERDGADHPNNPTASDGSGIE
jgi:hypothetical protein